MPKEETQDSLEEYESEVHSWVMSHGGSNLDGRISKSFFKGDRVSTAAVDWIFRAEQVTDGEVNIISDREIEFRNVSGETEHHITAYRSFNIDNIESHINVDFQASLTDIEDGAITQASNGDVRLQVEFSPASGEQPVKQNVNPKHLSEETSTLLFGSTIESLTNNSGTLSFKFFLNKATICSRRIEIGKIMIDGKDVLNDNAPFDILEGDYTDYSWIKNKKLTIIAGCELSYFSKLLKQAGMEIDHTFELHGAMDPYTELMNPTSNIDAGSSDYILLSQIQVIRPLITYWELNRGDTSGEFQKQQLNETIRALDWSLSKLRKDTGAPIWIISHVWTDSPSHGLNEYRGCGDELSTHEIAMWYKMLLYELCKKHDSTYVLDVDLAFDNFGKWPRGGHPSIRPFESLGGHPEQDGARVLASYFYHQLCIDSKHVSKVKCAILDCDETLWSGILREDGPDGVKVHKNRLRRLRNLSQRGLVLALCSKNDEEDAELIMQVLSAADKRFVEAIVTTRINWQPKSANIKSIVEELNIGFDTIVFFDDNPFERAEVSSILPEISVFDATKIEVAPNWPQFHPYGDINSESGKRFQLYKDEAERKQVEIDFEDQDFESFLHSCGLRLEIRAPQIEELPRVAELIQRTNQMNATLTRIDLPQIRDHFNSENHEIIITKLGDNFGDYGIIGTLICSFDDSLLRISELALSCRAMGRKVEHALLEEIVGVCNERGAKSIEIKVQKTSRNHQIIGILEEKGFISNSEQDGLHLFILDTSELEGRNYPPWFELTEVGEDTD